MEPVRVALLGCGVVGTEVARADDARRRAAPAGRRPARAGRHRRPAARPRPRPRRRPGPVHHRRRRAGEARRRRRRGHRRHRAGPLADPGGDGRRRARRHGQQGAARRGRPDAVRGGRRARRRPLLRGRRRRGHPAAAPAARVAGRRPGAPRARHRQRHHQLRARQDGHAPAWASPRRSSRPRRSATPRPTRPPTSRASTPPPRPRSWPRWPSTPGSRAADVHREGITGVTAADVASAQAMNAVVKLLAICERAGGARDGGEGVSRPRAPGDDPATPPAGRRRATRSTPSSSRPRRPAS